IPASEPTHRHVARVSDDGEPASRPRTTPTCRRAGTRFAPRAREEEENLVAERVAIETYREMVGYFGDRDSAAQVLLDRILARHRCGVPRAYCSTARSVFASSASTARRWAAVVNVIGSANSSAKIACCQLMSAAARMRGFVIETTCSGRRAMRSHHASAASRSPSWPTTWFTRPTPR